ncbi:MAG TPA: hypothetical protein VF552_12545, partial [Allosphingosinicella sp.]
MRAASRLILILILAVAQTATAAQTPGPDAQVAQRVDEYMEALWRVRRYGGSVLVAREGRLLVNRGYGL